MKRSGAAWMRSVLLAAALYNVLLGGFVVLFPLALFRFLGMELPNYPEIWQCVGMIVGVYGVGYAAAALDPLRHWPIVLVGFLGKVFGPVGFVYAVAAGDLPLRFGLTLLTNDAIWWFPFALILLRAYQANHQPKAASAHAFAARQRTPRKGTDSARQRKRAPRLRRARRNRRHRQRAVPPAGKGRREARRRGTRR